MSSVVNIFIYEKYSKFGIACIICLLICVIEHGSYLYITSWTLKEQKINKTVSLL